MRVLFDTNILLDLFLDRDPFADVGHGHIQLTSNLRGGHSISGASGATRSVVSLR